MISKKRKHLVVPGRIVSTAGNRVVVECETDKTKYKKGQIVVATVSTEEKTSDGKLVMVSDVVAQGHIENVLGNVVTISTRKRNPIVSQRAMKDAEKNAKQVRVRIVQ